jgi:hypothetical protein
MSALLAWPFALEFTIVAGCGGRASEPRATPSDASSHAGPEGGSAVDVMTVCATAQDCNALSTASSSVYCCTDNACVADQPGDCTDANVQLIQASSYDQSCKTDTDCVPISEGNACDLLPCCPNATISKSALAQYQSDLAKTRLGSCSISPTYGCNCGTYNFCCLNGSCQWDAECSSALAAAGDAGTDGGGAAEGGDASSSGGGYSLLNCPGGLQLPPACSTCIQSNCPAELAALNNACFTTFQCICPVGRDASDCGTAPASCNPAIASLMTACAGCTSLCAPADASAD